MPKFYLVYILKLKVNETLENVLEDSDDEIKSDAIVNQVLDEIGIEISNKLINVPNPSKLKLKEYDSDNGNKFSDKEIQNLNFSIEIEDR